MGFFSRLFGKNSSQSESNISFDRDAFMTPYTEDVDGNFLIHSFVSEVPTINPNQTLTCKSFYSEGMSKVGQEEVVLTIALPENEKDLHYLTLPYVQGLFKTIFYYASQGKTVTEGQYTVLGEKSSLLGYKGIVYAQNPEKAGDDIPDNCLSMILLHNKEIEAVVNMGYMRTLTMLGQERLRYPFPLWNELNRPIARFLDGMLSKTILSQALPRINDAGISVFQDANQQVVIQLPSSLDIDARQYNEMIRPGKALAFLPGFQKDAVLCFTWSEEQGINNLLSGSESEELPERFKIQGCLFVIIGSQQDEKAFINEDGFGAFINSEKWERFSDAFVQKKDISFEFSGGKDGDLKGIAISWN
jgi:hypothetical protein